jgi:hypothetical protein
MLDEGLDNRVSDALAPSSRQLLQAIDDGVHVQPELPSAGRMSGARSLRFGLRDVESGVVDQPANKQKEDSKSEVPSWQSDRSNSTQVNSSLTDHQGSRVSPRNLRSRAALEMYLIDHAFIGVNTPKWKITATGVKKTYPIHVAAKKGDVKFLQSLLDNGADVKKKDSRRRTAYDIARKFNYNHSHTGVLQVFAGMFDVIREDTKPDVYF